MVIIITIMSNMGHLWFLVLFFNKTLCFLTSSTMFNEKKGVGWGVKISVLLS